MGDNAAWAPFIKAGYDTMLNVALHGKGGMPAKGGNPTLSDYEVARAVVYMANKSGASLPEPAAPAEEGAKKKRTPRRPLPRRPLPRRLLVRLPLVLRPPLLVLLLRLPLLPLLLRLPLMLALLRLPQRPPQPLLLRRPPHPPPRNRPPPSTRPAKSYKSVCFACHATGVANAPKFGDKAAWAPFIKTGMDAMVKVAMQGKPPMPPKGGAANASEEDIRAAVQYMVDHAQ